MSASSFTLLGCSLSDLIISSLVLSERLLKNWMYVLQII